MKKALRQNNRRNAQPTTATGHEAYQILQKAGNTSSHIDYKFQYE